jgi:hypothetical protein
MATGAVPPSAIFRGPGEAREIVDNSLTSYNPPPGIVPPIHNKNTLPT